MSTQKNNCHFQRRLRLLLKLSFTFRQWILYYRSSTLSIMLTSFCTFHDNLCIVYKCWIVYLYSNEYRKSVCQKKDHLQIVLSLTIIFHTTSIYINSVKSKSRAKELITIQSCQSMQNHRLCFDSNFGTFDSFKHFFCYHSVSYWFNSPRKQKKRCRESHKKRVIVNPFILMERLLINKKIVRNVNISKKFNREALMWNKNPFWR